MKQPKVSAIVTTKNEHKNIGRLLASVKNQTYKNIEIITVDNNSTDNTQAIAKHYGKVYNKGPERSTQRNYGATQATGHYVLFLDADMELTPYVIAACVNAITNKVAIIIPEESIGKTYWERVKALERNCYIGDADMELPRFFATKTFFQLGGFDTKITGPEIEDLYYRVLQKGTVGRINAFIIHHEQVSQLRNILKKKYYYCKSLGRYIQQSPALAQKQFKFIRPSFVKNWRTLLKNPHLTLGFFIMRTGEGFAALFGLLNKR